METLVELGINRILTSGQAKAAWEGRKLLGELVRAAGDRIVVMAGGAIDEPHVAELIAETGVREIHLRATTEREVRFKAVVGRVRG